MATISGRLISHESYSIGLVQIFRMFPDDAAAEAWFVARWWPTGVACPRCGSLNGKRYEEPFTSTMVGKSAMGLARREAGR